jgi:fumarate reductase subunit C
MTANTDFSEYRQRLYRQPVSRLWWLRRRSYLIFVIRELTSLAVAWAVVYMMLLVYAVSRGEDQYQRFLDRSGQPWMIAVNVLALLLAIFHAVTWFNLVPQALVLRVRGRRVPGPALVAAHFALWAVASAVVAWVVLA